MNGCTERKVRMGTFYHILRPNKRCGAPSTFIFYDTETTEKARLDGAVEHHLKLGVACYHKRRRKCKPTEQWLTFRSPTEFWSWVTSKLEPKKPLWLIAHNQHFDFMVVQGFPQLARLEFTATRPIIDSNRFIVSFVKPPYKIEVVDSLNWFKSSIAQLGRVLGLPKLKINFKTCSDEELEVYCKRDVEILKETMLKWIQFLKENDLGNFQKTIAAQAFAAFRHRFMKHPIAIHANPNVIPLERKAYFGGRTECFYIGRIKEPIYVLDFNSLYPSVMRDNLFPVKLAKYGENLKVEWLEKCLNRFLVIAEVTVKTDVPAFPYRAEKLVFPTGTFTTYLCTPELKLALQKAKILNVGEYALYYGAPIFSDYVKTLYFLRRKFKREGNKVYDLLTKLLLNSLYGKFGQKQDVIREVGIAPPDIVAFNEIYYVTERKNYVEWIFGGKIFLREATDKEWKHSFPAIAAHVSSYARVKLWRAIEQAGLGNVYYCDTDSLFVNQQGLENLKDMLSSYELGKLKLEHSSYQTLIFGLKDYILNGKRKLKGISREAVRISDNVFVQPKWLKFRSLIRQGQLEHPIVETTIKKLRRVYDKGVVLPDGRVRPFQLP